MPEENKTNLEMNLKFKSLDKDEMDFVLGLLKSKNDQEIVELTPKVLPNNDELPKLSTWEDHFFIHILQKRKDLQL
jgi:hypothetical protein